MKATRTRKPVAEVLPVDNRISVRLDHPIADRLHRVVMASKRTRTSVLEECLEHGLPKLEKQFASAA